MPQEKTAAVVTLELTGGDAAVVDLGKMLGPTGVNMIAVKRAYDEATSSQRGDVVPVVVTVRGDKSFELRLKTPPTAFLVKKELAATGSARPGHENVGVLTLGQLREIAVRKLPDLNTDDVEKAMRTVAGTARSMGVKVEEP